MHLSLDSVLVSSLTVVGSLAKFFHLPRMAAACATCLYLVILL
jgi:hypothetical protein